jgi:uncharacterized protein (DUF4415 family)
MSRITFKQNELQPISQARSEELKALSDKPDTDIDCHEIPELDAVFWRNAERGKLYKPIKTPATVRFDNDVLAWLKLQGKGYQTRLNAILREAMLNDLKNQHR